MSPAVVAGRYSLERMLARRGATEVWRATDLTAAGPVALHLLPAPPDEPSRERFRAGARRALALRAPGLAPVTDVGESADGVSAWVVTGLVEGDRLADRLVRSGPLAPQLGLDVLARVADALQAADDAGVETRDVTAADLVLRDGGSVLTDGTVVVDALLGAPSDPDSTEAASSAPDPSRSVRALGRLGRSCLPTADGAGSLLAAAQALVGRCLADDPATRPADAAQVAAEARTLARPVPARRPLRFALPVVLVGLLILLGRALTDHGTTLGVPQVRAGSSAVEARRQVLDAGLRIRWRTEVAPEVPEGRVVRTDPAAGTRVRAGSSVALVLSGEVLVGLPYERARAVLVRRGLRPRPVADASGGPPGTVRRLEPEGPLEPGSEVVVHVVPPAGSEGTR